MNNDIKARIKKVLINKMLQGVNPEDIGDDTPLIEFGVGADSVATLELTVALEEEFHINIDESEINPELIKDINTIADYISKRM